MIEELTATADTQVSQPNRAHTTLTETASDIITNDPPAEEPEQNTPREANPDADYLAHIVYHSDIRDLTDHDLIDCLRGSANASCFGPSSPEVIEEQITLIAELQARSFTTKAIVGIIIVGAEEGRRQHQHRIAKQMAAGDAADSSAADHSATNQYGA